jgi:AraC-like DNA-binding protein
MGNILIPIRKFRRLLDYMETIGLDAEAIAASVDLSVSRLKAIPDEQGLPAEFYSQMFRQAVQQWQTLDRPIPWAAGIGSEAFELLCHCIITCKTLGEALQRAARFDRLLYPLLGHRVETTLVDEHCRLRYRVRVEARDNVFAPEGWDRAAHTKTVANASGLTVWYALSGWLVGRSIELQSAHISGSYVSDDYRDGLKRVFHCPIEFDSEENELVFSGDYLSHRLVHTPESLQEFLSNAVYQLIVLNSKPASTSAAIRSLIKMDFSEGLPSFEQMADNLHMSESSLRRRLLKEETSYQNIKDQVRCEIAVEHLRHPTIKINELAGMLGFTEPSSFVRSFRSWTGVTPKAYRDNMLELQSA